MAKRLGLIISNCINSDRMGFILHRHMSDNIRKSLNIINYCLEKKIPSLILALDAEKALDHLESTSLQKLLKLMDLDWILFEQLKCMQTLWPIYMLIIWDLWTLNLPEALSRGAHCHPYYLHSPWNLLPKLYVQMMILKLYKLGKKNIC